MKAVHIHISDRIIIRLHEGGFNHPEGKESLENSTEVKMLSVLSDEKVVYATFKKGYVRTYVGSPFIIISHD